MKKLETDQMAHWVKENLFIINPYTKPELDEETIDVVVNLLKPHPEKIRFLYNHFMKISNDIPFNVGDIVESDNLIYRTIDGDRKAVPMGNAEIIEKNLYAVDKLKVKYVDNLDIPLSDYSFATKWINHKNLKLWKPG